MSIPFTKDLQDKVRGARSRLSTEVEKYLDGVVDMTASLALFPAHPHFDTIHQPVRVRAQPKGVNPMEATTPVVWDDDAHAAYPRVIFKGGPGSGKSWLLLYEAYVLANTQLKKIQQGEITLDQVVLPLFLRLPALAESLRERGGSSSVIEALPSVCKELAKTSAAFERFLRGRLEAGKVLLLFDRWEGISVSQRNGFLRALDAFVDEFPLARMMLSSRIPVFDPIASFTVQRARAAKFDVLELLPFDDGEIKKFANAWFPKGAGPFIRQVMNPDIVHLARIPLSLTLLCVIAEADPLPALKSEIYRLFLQRFLENAWGRLVRDEDVSADEYDIVLLATMLRSLAKASLELFAAAKSEGEGFTEARLLRLLKKRRRILALLKRDGLLTEIEPGRAGIGAKFGLLRDTILEYLAAAELAGHFHAPNSPQRVERAMKQLFKHKGDSAPAIDERWDNVISFLPGIHLYGVGLDPPLPPGDIERLLRYVDCLVERAPARKERAGRVYGHAARAMFECASDPTADPRIKKHAKRIAQKVSEAFERFGKPWPLRDRLYVLEALGRLGDPRLGDPRKDTSIWVNMMPRVAKKPSALAEFTMGVSDGEYREIVLEHVRLVAPPKHRVRLGPFWMSSRPVTVADFAPFVAQGYRVGRGHRANRAFWTDGRTTDDGIEPFDWQRQLAGPRNVPVTGVSWFAARAFCRWASAHWKLPVELARLGRARLQVTLPTEAEWEYAVRGKSLDSFPWGDIEPGKGDDAQANYHFEGSPARPTPVGAFPSGNTSRWAGPVVDLVGNVWEWCEDAWRERNDPSWPRGRQPENPCHHRVHAVNHEHVLRGGSWNLGPRSTRFGHRARSRLPSLGFRLVCRPVYSSR